VDELLGGKDGLYANCKPGTVLVIHSTISPDACRRFAKEAREYGLGVLDAPVTGMTVRAETGDLTIYVGGEAGDLEKARDGLNAMGSTVLHMGAIGMGQVTKILNNAITVPLIALIAETIELGVACGIDQAILRRAFEAGSADSFTLRNFGWFQTIWISDERGGVEDTARRIGKDLNLAFQLAREHDLDLPMAGVAIANLPQVVVRTIRKPGPG
jgi:3-hydroxyisobutyrate dehydrogenase-like beta-hydroxyacid dehydrogenase